MTDHREAVARIERYISEYEDALNWGGPPMRPAPPSIADLKALLRPASGSVEGEKEPPEMSNLFDAAAFAGRVRAKMETDGLGYRAAARLVPCSSATLNRVSRGHVPDVENYLRLSRWLGDMTAAEIIENYGRGPEHTPAPQPDPIHPATPDKAADGWQPIETAPKDGAWFLAHCKRGEPPVSMAFWDDGFGELAKAGWFMIEADAMLTGCDPTHWRQLPAPPAETGGAA